MNRNLEKQYEEILGKAKEGDIKIIDKDNKLVKDAKVVLCRMANDGMDRPPECIEQPCDDCDNMIIVHPSSKALKNVAFLCPHCVNAFIRRSRGFAA